MAASLFICKLKEKKARRRKKKFESDILSWLLVGQLNNLVGQCLMSALGKGAFIRGWGGGGGVKKSRHLLEGGV